MNWIDTLEKLAPTVASALGTPVAGMAVAALESALGITGADNIQKTIEDNKLTGDQVAALQQAELKLKSDAQQLGLNFEQLAVTDRTSARSMQIATQSWLPPMLSILIIGGFATITGLKIAGITVPVDAIGQDLVTTLRDSVILVLSFYFGSSSGSQKKDQLLYNSTPST